MRNPYMQVALTYPRRLLGSWYLMVIMVGPTVAILTGFTSRHSQMPAGFGLLFLWWPYMILISHVKEQFASARSRLTPGFARPHMAVAAGAMALVAVVLPMALALARGVPILGVVGLFVGLFGVTAWSVVGGAWWAWGITMAVAIGTMRPPLGPWVQELFEGQHVWAAVVVLSAGIAAAVIAAIRLVRLDEEMPTYHQVPAFDSQWTKARRGGPVKPAQGSSWLQRFTNKLQDGQMERLIQAAARAPQSHWAQIRRWQVGLIGGPALALIGLSAFAFTELVAWLTSGRRDAVHEMPWLGYAVMAATIIAIGGLTRRRQALGREMLLPVARGVFLRQAALAVALTQLQICLAVVLPVMATGLIHWPNAIDLTTWAWSMAVFALLQVLFLSVILWALRFRGQGAHLALLMGAIMATSAAIPLVQLATETGWTQWRGGILAVAGGLALLGLLILYDAYRRWLRVELG